MSLEEVTIFVIPRQIYGQCVNSLKSIFEHLGKNRPTIIYHAAGLSKKIRKELEEVASGYSDFRFYESEGYDFISPNEARNLMLSELKANCKYLITIDTDVIVRAGWLESLVSCAEETGAGLVGPAYIDSDFETGRVHMLGGGADVRPCTDEPGKFLLTETLFHFGENFAELAPKLTHYFKTEHIEFHTCLISRAFIEALIVAQRESGARGLAFDEGFMSLSDHLDASLEAKRLGFGVYIEPRAVVCFPQPKGAELSPNDFTLLQIRWSDRWNSESIRHIKKKWKLSSKDVFAESSAYWMSYHRGRILFKSLLSWLPSRLTNSGKFLKFCLIFESLWNKVLFKLNEHRMYKGGQQIS